MALTLRILKQFQVIITHFFMKEYDMQLNHNIGKIQNIFQAEIYAVIIAIDKILDSEPINVTFKILH